MAWHTVGKGLVVGRVVREPAGPAALLQKGGVDGRRGLHEGPAAMMMMMMMMMMKQRKRKRKRKRNIMMRIRPDQRAPDAMMMMMTMVTIMIKYE